MLSEAEFLQNADALEQREAAKKSKPKPSADVGWDDDWSAGGELGGDAGSGDSKSKKPAKAGGADKDDEDGWDDW